MQCGFCTPGMLVSAKALLDRTPHPDGGGGAGRPRRQPLPLYRLRGIVRAVVRAAEELTAPRYERTPSLVELGRSPHPALGRAGGAGRLPAWPVGTVRLARRPGARRVRRLAGRALLPGRRAELAVGPVREPHRRRDRGDPLPDGSERTRQADPGVAHARPPPHCRQRRRRRHRRRARPRRRLAGGSGRPTGSGLEPPPHGAGVLDSVGHRRRSAAARRLPDARRDRCAAADRRAARPPVAAARRKRPREPGDPCASPPGS